MAVARHLQQPTRRATGAGRPEPARRQDALLFGLAPDGVYRAKPVTRPAGELLPHRFTLTSRRTGGRSLFCGTFPNLAAGGRYPPSHPTEPGLSSRRKLEHFGTESATLYRHEKACFPWLRSDRCVDALNSTGDHLAHSDSLGMVARPGGSGKDPPESLPHQNSGITRNTQR